MRPKHKTGFTLIELAIVITVLSLVIAGVASVMTQDIRRNKAADLQAKMDTIEAKLTNFRRLYGRLPCPADGTYGPSSQYFGVEASAAGVCTNSQTYVSGNRTTNTIPPAANFYDGTNTVAGVIPIRTLGLPDDAILDPWGNKFFYAVDKRITSSAGPAFTTYTPSNGTIGSISVYDGSSTPTAISGTPRTTKAIAIVLSAGSNGHGAYQMNGTRKTAYSNNIDEKQNCHCDASVTATTFDYKFVQHPATTTSTTDPTYNFDDTMRYYLRNSFMNAADSLVPGAVNPVSFKFDFGTGASPVAAGYTQVTEATTYSAPQGYGWTAGVVSSADRGVGTDLSRDFCYSWDMTFQVDVPNGNYLVEIMMGDMGGGFAHDLQGIYLQGNLVDTVTTAGGQTHVGDYVATVSNGHLVAHLLDLGGSDSNDVIEYMTVTSQ